MKRSSLSRRSRLNRGTKRLQRHKPLRSQSRKARRERRSAQPVIDAVYRRDMGCLLDGYQPNRLVGDCFGHLTPHHLRKQSAERGGWTLDNLVTLCLGHNGWVEDHPADARRLGLVVRRGETTGDAWARMSAAGLPVAAGGGIDA